MNVYYRRLFYSHLHKNASRQRHTQFNQFFFFNKYYEFYNVIAYVHGKHLWSCRDGRSVNHTKLVLSAQLTTNLLESVAGVKRPQKRCHGKFARKNNLAGPGIGPGTSGCSARRAINWVMRICIRNSR